MRSVNEKKFQEAINNDYYRKILNKVCNKQLKGVCSQDEISSLMMNTLWDCVERFDKKKNVKFSSYLYRSIENNARRAYRKKAKEFKCVSLIDNYHSFLVTSDETKKEVAEILESLKFANEEYYNILIQRFFYGMTNREIGQANGYTGEAARKKIKKALKLCREIVYS